MKQAVTEELGEMQFRVDIPISSMKAYTEKDEDGEDRRVVEGIASSTTLDSQGDRISVKALKDMSTKAEGIDLLRTHRSDWDDVIGNLTETKVSNGKLKVKASLNDSEGADALFNRVKKRQQIGLSIGGFIKEFHTESHPDDEDRIVRVIDELELDHVAATRTPANPDAWIGGLAKAVDWSKAEHRDSLVKVETDSIGVPIINVTVNVPGTAEPVDKGPVQFKTYPLAPLERAWEGAAAVRRLRKWAGGPAKDDMDWIKYRRPFSWFDAGDTQNFGSFKLPHHDIVGGDVQTVWSGVVAAMAALLGARGGVSIPDVDKKGVYNHLAKHYGEFDREPPEFVLRSEMSAEDFWSKWSLPELEYLWATATLEHPEEHGSLTEERDAEVIISLIDKKRKEVSRMSKDEKKEEAVALKAKEIAEAEAKAEEEAQKAKEAEEAEAAQKAKEVEEAEAEAKKEAEEKASTTSKEEEIEEEVPSPLDEKMKELDELLEETRTVAGMTEKTVEIDQAVQKAQEAVRIEYQAREDALTQKHEAFVEKVTDSLKEIKTYFAEVMKSIPIRKGLQTNIIGREGKVVAIGEDEEKKSSPGRSLIEIMQDDDVKEALSKHNSVELLLRRAVEEGHDVRV